MQISIHMRAHTESARNIGDSYADGGAPISQCTLMVQSFAPKKCDHFFHILILFFLVRHQKLLILDFD